MSAVLEERNTHEVLDRNEVIEALKKEVEVLGAEKTRLMAEVGGLSATRAEAESLRKEADSLWKQIEVVKTVEALAIERASKANETANNLRREIDAEKQSSLALQQ
jgi:cell division protein FtsB